MTLPPKLTEALEVATAADQIFGEEVLKAINELAAAMKSQKIEQIAFNTPIDIVVDGAEYGESIESLVLNDEGYLLLCDSQEDQIALVDISNDSALEILDEILEGEVTYVSADSEEEDVADEKSFRDDSTKRPFIFSQGFQVFMVLLVSGYMIWSLWDRIWR